MIKMEMRSILRQAALAVPVVLATMTHEPIDAHACGGCFVPPEESTVVTGHRMILSVGMTQSTLYDQIEYAGEPEEFGWVLPIVGTVDVGTSSDLIFNQLGFDTGVRVLPPVQECPQIYCDGFDEEAPNSDGLSSSATTGGGAQGGGVDVLAEEVVGPYETVQLSADDPEALNLWLVENGYNIPSDIQPVIDDYVAEGFNFLAMKLAPGAGIDRMAPVRITTQGSNAVLPLRMVAAGTGANTTITLWNHGRRPLRAFQLPELHPHLRSGGVELRHRHVQLRRAARFGVRRLAGIRLARGGGERVQRRRLPREHSERGRLRAGSEWLCR